MSRVEQIRAMLLSQCSRYPGLQPQDLLKALHQSVMGNGHLVADEAGGWQSISMPRAPWRSIRIPRDWRCWAETIAVSIWGI